MDSGLRIVINPENRRVKALSGARLDRLYSRFFEIVRMSFIQEAFDSGSLWNMVVHFDIRNGGDFFSRGVAPFRHL